MASSGILKPEDTCVEWQGQPLGQAEVHRELRSVSLTSWEPPCHSMIPSPPAQIGLHMIQLRKFPANPSATAVQGPGLFLRHPVYLQCPAWHLALGRYSVTCTERMDSVDSLTCKSPWERCYFQL